MLPAQAIMPNIQASMNNAAFGTVGSATGNTGSRDFQLSGRINF